MSTEKEEAPRPTVTPPEPPVPVRATKPPPVPSTVPPAPPPAPDPISEALAKALESPAIRDGSEAHKSAAGKAVNSSLDFARSMRDLRSKTAPVKSDLTGKMHALKPT